LPADAIKVATQYAPKDQPCGAKAGGSV